MCSFVFKAGLINVFIFTMDEITMLNVKGVARTDEHADNYQPTLCSILESFSSLLLFIYRVIFLLVDTKNRATVKGE